MLRLRPHHEGTPTSVIERIVDMDVYIAKPANESESKAILFIRDVLGFAKARLLADDYAREGICISVPRLASRRWRTMAHVASWQSRYSEALGRPLLDKFVESLRADPAVGKVRAFGFCWHARYVLDLCDAGTVDAMIGFDRSFPIQPEFASVTKPKQINGGTNDIFMSNKLLAQTKTAMEKRHVPSEINIIEGAVHGFAVRGNLTNTRQKVIKGRRSSTRPGG
ncbi:hypothetical protein CALCODRAFT_458735 [Calocera cornea HHB12733]|uniref:Dienelactone hydrolase domain-containing protein n=1 Tax=Calocera cornea HHB12733 TaxID=1353952 RepID=A0A165DHP5_9BASI|nr:hypothetical protein CALCODRAFT_458735 [Calocera cornea HHB12733]